MKRILLVTAICFAYIVAYGQGFDIANYNRSSISVMVVPNPGSNGELLRKAFGKNETFVDIGGRWFFNELDNVILNTQQTQSAIEGKIKEEHIAAKALSVWRNTDTLVNRATYNLNEQQRRQLDASVRGSEGVKDERWFKYLLQSNYILVLSVDKVEDVSRITSKRELVSMAKQLLTGTSFSTVKKNRVGYVGKVTAYLYRISMDNKDYAAFMQNWGNDSLHFNYPYSIELIDKKTVGVDATKGKNEGQENVYIKMHRFVSVAAQTSLMEVGDSYLPITPKAMVMKGNPVRAEIGRKEALKTDDIVFVYALHEKKDGTMTYLRRGTYRVKYVGDNRDDGTQTSTFYNINWGRAKEGMLIIPHEDVGISITPGVYVMPTTVYKLGIAFSFNHMRNQIQSARTKLIADFAYIDNLTDNNAFFDYYASVTGNSDFRSANKLRTVVYGLGLQRDVYILPFMQLSPYFMIMLEHSWYKDKNVVDAAMGYFQLPSNYGRIIYPQFGLKVPINITYNFKIVPEAAFAAKINSLSVGVGSSSNNDGSYPLYIVKKDRFFTGLSLQFDF